MTANVPMKFLFKVGNKFILLVAMTVQRKVPVVVDLYADSFM